MIKESRLDDNNCPHHSVTASAAISQTRLHTSSRQPQRGPLTLIARCEQYTITFCSLHEVASDIISGFALDDVGLDVCVKFG